ncbi:MAG: hypothetical protein ACRDYW_11985 [Acidimicrobiales bacterium]
MVLAIVLLVAGCSTGDDEGSATTTTADAASTTAPTFTGDPGSPFCELLRGVDASVVPSGDLADPATVEVTFRELVRVLHDALAVAPPEVEGDLALVSQGIDALDASLSQVGYDFDVLAASGEADTISEAVNDPAFADAGARLAAYRGQVCGL